MPAGLLSAELACSAEMQDGKYLKKRNTFTDVVAAAEHLIAEKYTSKSMLCIQVRQPLHVILICDIQSSAYRTWMLLHAVMCMVTSIDI